MSGNKKIAINSLILYIKLIITTLIGLFTMRLVLLELGADDYGLFSVVGGIVVILNLLSTSMLVTTYRFIAIELGKGNIKNLNRIFNTSLTMHLILAALFVLLAETIGVLYIINYLNVSPEKIQDALFVLHLTVLATVFSVAGTPYQGLIVAQERFFITSAIHILCAILTLIFIILLTYYIGNKLRAYAVIMAIINIIPSLFYFIYCFVKNNKVIKWKLNKNKYDYLEILNFMVWSIIGGIAYMSLGQGSALLINIFFGTTLNAAFAIASQISTQTMTFVTNLTQAAVPQIQKSYGSGNSERTLEIVYNISKYAFFVTLIPAVPILLSIDAILRLWLTVVPEFTKPFVVLMLINGLVSSPASGFNAAIQATGKIRKNQTYYSLIMLSILPITYILFLFNFPPYIITVISIGATITYIFVQVHILKNLTDFKVSKYLSKTVKPIFWVALITIPQILIRHYWGQSFIDVIIFSIVSIILIIITIYFIGLNNQEKIVVNNYIKKIKFI